MKRIGVDIGGTSIKFALIENTADILLREQYPTVKNSPQALAKQVADIIRRSCPDFAGIPIGIACAGNITEDDLLTADNLSFINVPFRKLIEENLGRPVYLEQDAHAAMMAEMIAGSLRGERNAVFLTLGTGVGGDAIINGVPYREIKHRAFEIGHIVTHVKGELCSCGERGCFERYASVSALVRHTKGHSCASTIIAAVKTGDTAVTEIWKNYIQEICTGLINLCRLIDPDIISIGGGISSAGDFFVQSIYDGLSLHPFWQHRKQRPEIRLAQFKNDAGVLGASALAQKKYLRSLTDTEKEK